jgi:hypothetical protein
MKVSVVLMLELESRESLADLNNYLLKSNARILFYRAMTIAGD